MALNVYGGISAFHKTAKFDLKTDTHTHIAHKGVTEDRIMECLTLLIHLW